MGYFEWSATESNYDHFLQADFTVLIAVSERHITSVWPAIDPKAWSSFPRTPFLAS